MEVPPERLLIFGGGHVGKALAWLAADLGFAATVLDDRAEFLQTGPDGTAYAFTHDTELQLTKVTNPQGLTWTYEYDPAGRLISETDFDGWRKAARTFALHQVAPADVTWGVQGQTQDRMPPGLSEEK